MVSYSYPENNYNPTILHRDFFFILFHNLSSKPAPRTRVSTLRDIEWCHHDAPCRDHQHTFKFLLHWSQHWSEEKNGDESQMSKNVMARGIPCRREE